MSTLTICRCANRRRGRVAYDLRKHRPSRRCQECTMSIRLLAFSPIVPTEALASSLRRVALVASVIVLDGVIIVAALLSARFDVSPGGEP